MSLVDCYSTVLEAVGCPVSGRRPRAAVALAVGDRRGRAVPIAHVLSEYHAAASITGTFMIRHGRWKYIYHVGYRPELFDLESDPGETTDLAEQPDMAPVLAECEAALLRICDPEAVSAEAFADQRRRIAQHGGRDAIMAARRLWLYAGAGREAGLRVVGDGLRRQRSQ